MKSISKHDAKVPRLKGIHSEGPNWMLILGGAFLSTLSIRLGYKLRQAIDGKRDNVDSKGHEKNAERRRMGIYQSNSTVHSFGLDDNSYFNCAAGERESEINGQILTEDEGGLPLVTIPRREYGTVWVSSPKPFHESNTSSSPCVSESGSDIFSKRDVIQKLRQQLKRRDDMIMEMQDQVTQLRTSLNTQTTHSNDLQTQLESANRDLFESEREIQKLRKVIADHCLGHENPPGKENCYVNGFSNGHAKSKGDEERVEGLRREIGEWKEVIEGKEFLVQSYKEQKVELCLKVKELQQRLDSQLPQIL